MASEFPISDEILTRIAVRHPNADAETAARLLCDREPKIREWAAALSRLTQDPVAEVNQAASHR